MVKFSPYSLVAIKLGGENYYRRPKGMHESTHARKMAEIWEAEEVVDGYLAMFMMQKVKKLKS